MSKLIFISPFFIVSNLKDSVSFYINKLGLKYGILAPTIVRIGPWWAVALFLLC